MYKQRFLLHYIYITLHQLLQPQASKPADDRARLVERQHKQKWYHARSAKDLKPLEKGDAMRMKPLRPSKKEWRKALVVNRHDQRSYTVTTSDGRTYRRDRVYLRKTQEPPPSSRTTGQHPQTTYVAQAS